MAGRIRTYKPDFFTDSRTGKLSPIAKVVFLGLMSQCDDFGVLRYEPEELKVKILPYERLSVDDSIESSVVEAERLGLLDRFDDGEKVYLHIKGFTKHQRIARKSSPLLSGWDAKMTAKQYVETHLNESFDELPFEASESQLEEPEVDEGSTSKKSGKTKKVDDGIPDTPYEAIVALYHQHFPVGPKVRGELSDARKKKVRTRFREAYRGTPKGERTVDVGLKAFEALFKKASNSQFLCGQNNGDFVADFDFICTSAKSIRIMEGFYERNNKQQGGGYNGYNNNSHNNSAPPPSRRRPPVVSRHDLSVGGGDK